MRLKVKRSSPVLDDAEIEAGELSVDEGLEDTDGPASIVLTVGISHLHTRTRTHTHVVGFHGTLIRVRGS